LTSRGVSAAVAKRRAFPSALRKIRPKFAKIQCLKSIGMDFLAPRKIRARQADASLPATVSSRFRLEVIFVTRRIATP
jgi:hypothetical protein